MIVYVVMENDFPAAVFSTQEKAMEFIVEMKCKTQGSQPKVYWEKYAFAVDEVPLS